jgi:hypothetical protein
MTDKKRHRFRGHVGSARRIDYFVVRNAAVLSRFRRNCRLHGYQDSTEPVATEVESNWRIRC